MLSSKLEQVWFVLYFDCYLLHQIDFQQRFAESCAEHHCLDWCALPPFFFFLLFSLFSFLLWMSLKYNGLTLPIVTGGLDTGVMKFVGDAVRDQVNTFPSLFLLLMWMCQDADVPCIGVATYSRVVNKDLLVVFLFFPLPLFPSSPSPLLPLFSSLPSSSLWRIC